MRAKQAQEEAKNEAIKERKRQDSIIAEQKNDVARKEAEDKSLFERQYYQDVTKRADVQNMVRTLEDNQRNAETRDAARAAIAGATPEQKLASKEVNRRAFADSLADIASNTAQMRDQYVRDYSGQADNTLNRRLGIGNVDMQLGNPLIAINQNTAAQNSQAASNAFATAGKLAGSILGAAEGSFGGRILNRIGNKLNI